MNNKKQICRKKRGQFHELEILFTVGTPAGEPALGVDAEPSLADPRVQLALVQVHALTTTEVTGWAHLGPGEPKRAIPAVGRPVTSLAGRAPGQAQGGTAALGLEGQTYCSKEGKGQCNFEEAWIQLLWKPHQVDYPRTGRSGHWSGSSSFPPCYPGRSSPSGRALSQGRIRTRSCP